ncbi:MAG TPA: gluconate 2-dehydrogenase subunit 3 family protein [Kiloniellales bacterium]
MDRREFLTILSGVIAATAASDALAAAHDGHGQGSVHTASALGQMRKVYTYFTHDEAAFVEAAVSRLIPADDLGPGALEAEVPYFIDQQLSGWYGEGARYYNQGPYGDDTGYQGYQFALNPRQLYRAAIAATDDYCVAKHGKVFAALDGATQDAVLLGLQGVSEDVTLAEVPGAAFFGHLLADAKDGFFADPAYGGNKGKVGWKLVGFPGVAANYKELVGKNEPYDVEPVDIGDVKEARVPVDRHGHPVHRRADAESIPRTKPGG